MGTVTALVDRETALGFRLAGIGARTAETPEELLAQAEAVRSDPGVRLVLLDESLFGQIPEKQKRRLEDCRSPLFVPIPVFRPSKGAVKPEEYVARLMRRAIGYQIRIRR
jgi:vacuolar-type H+-ATPase subunit F/Vma7